MRIEFLAAAEEELQQAARFYERQVAGLGDAFLDAVERAAQAIVETADLGHSFAGPIRRRLSGDSPFPCFTLSTMLSRTVAKECWSSPSSTSAESRAIGARVRLVRSN